MATAKQNISTKQNIRLSAEKLFRQRGYAAIGMRELAKAVGIEAPSIYNHYKSKDELLSEICFDMAAQFFNAFDTAAATEEKLPKKLKAVIKAHIGVIAINISASEVFFNEWMFLEEPNLAKFKKQRHEYEMKFRDIIDKGIKKGEFKKMNSKLIAFAIFSALNATHELLASNEKLSQEEIAEGISDLLLKGIKL
jgi:AcrR family transcriptional regulator